MRTTILIALLILGMNVSAAQNSPASQTLISDPELGEFSLSIIDVGEPVFNPLLVRLTLQCKGQRKAKVIFQEKICKFEGHKFNEANKVLTLKMLTAALVVGDAPCSDRSVEPQPFDLKDLCSNKR